MKQPRLLIFHPTIAPYRIDFFNDLYKAFETRVCLQFWNLRDQTFDYDKIYAQFAFKPHYLKEVLKIGKKSFWGGFAKHINQFNPDIVMVSEFDLFTIMILLHRFITRKHYKIVSLCDDSYNMVAENNDHSIIHRLLRKWVVPKFDEIILVEPNVTEWYQQHYGIGFCFPIIKPDDSARSAYSQVLAEGQALKANYRLDDKRIFMFVGRLVALKNVNTALRAFAQLNQEENVFVIVGEGPERSHLEALARELSLNTLFLGRKEGDALNACYTMADILVLPSYQEAFGAVTNEALLAGCYALISNKAGSASLIEEGVNGYTFPPMDVDALAEKMRLLSQQINPSPTNTLKPNRMLVSYREKMNELIDFLKRVAHN